MKVVGEAHFRSSSSNIVTFDLPDVFVTLSILRRSTSSQRLEPRDGGHVQTRMSIFFYAAGFPKGSKAGPAFGCLHGQYLPCCAASFSVLIDSMVSSARLRATGLIDQQLQLGSDPYDAVLAKGVCATCF